MKGLIIAAALAALAGCSTDTRYDPPVIDATRGASAAPAGGSAPSYYSGGRALELDPVPSPAPQVPARAAPQSAPAAGVVRPYVAEEPAPESYVVKRGDTLYSIAFRYGRDYRELAAANGIGEPYHIEVGQRLAVRGPARAAAAPAPAPSEPAPVPVRPREAFYSVQKGDTANSVARRHGMTLKELAALNHLAPPYNIYAGQKLKVDGTEVPVAGENSPAPAPRQALKILPGKTRTVAGIKWMRPAAGQVVKSYSAAETGNNGIDIANRLGTEICAAADGQVVYAGSALRGYGNLIIINHENEYLSAYAHNETLLVSEGQNVRRGQVVARMGSTDSDRVKLHFEIRHQGNTENPDKYLPPAN